MFGSVNLNFFHFYSIVAKEPLYRKKLTANSVPYKFIYFFDYKLVYYQGDLFSSTLFYICLKCLMDRIFIKDFRVVSLWLLLGWNSCFFFLKHCWNFRIWISILHMEVRKFEPELCLISSVTLWICKSGYIWILQWSQPFLLNFVSCT